MCWYRVGGKPGVIRMLTIKERQEVLKWLRRFCTVDLFPIQVDIQGIAVPAWQVHVLAFDLVNRNLEVIATKALKPRCALGRFRINRLYRVLRCLQLYVTLLNTVHENIIFTWKLQSIGMSIFGGYAAIAHFRDYPVFGVMYYVVLVDMSLIYMLIYEKGFKVPDMFQRAKNMVRPGGKQLPKRRSMENPEQAIDVDSTGGHQRRRVSYAREDINSRLSGFRLEQHCEHACSISISQVS